MEFRTYFKQMDSSEALVDYAKKRLGHPIEKFHAKISEAHLTFAVEAGVFHVHCRLIVAGEGEVTAQADDMTSMYAAVDQLTDKLEAQLRRAKEKHRSHRERTTIDMVPVIPTPAPVLDPSMSIDAAEIIATLRDSSISTR